MYIQLVKVCRSHFELAKDHPVGSWFSGCIFYLAKKITAYIARIPKLEEAGHFCVCEHSR